MTKAQEIKTLESLRKDSYFSAHFSNADIDAMIDNIRKDFDLLTSTRIGEELTQRTEAINQRDDAQNELEKVLLRLNNAKAQNEKIFGELIEGTDSEEVLENNFAIEKRIKFKLMHSLNLTGTETDFMINML